MNFAKSGGDIDRCEMLVTEGVEERAGTVSFRNFDFSGGQNAAGARNSGHVGYAGSWEA